MRRIRPLQRFWIALGLLLGVCCTFGGQGGAAAQGMMGLLAGSGGGGSAQAEAPDSGTDTRLQTLINEARELGSPVIVIPVDAPNAAPDPAITSTTSTTISSAVAVRNAIGDTLRSAHDLVPAVMTLLQNASPREDGFAWMGRTAVLIALSLGIAFGARLVVYRFARSYLHALHMKPNEDRIQRTASVLLRLAIDWLARASFLVAGLAFIIATSPGQTPARLTAQVVLFMIALFLFVRALVITVFAPDRPTLRLVALSDDVAHAMSGRLITIFAVTTVVFAVVSVPAALGLDITHSDLLRITLAFIATAQFIAFAIVFRREIATLIRGQSGSPHWLRKGVAPVWHVLFVFYLAVAFGLTVVAVVTSEGFRSGPILGPMLATLAGLVTFGIAVIVIDRQVRARQEALYAASGGTARGVGPSAMPVEGLADGLGSGELDPLTKWQLRWKGFADKVAGVSAVVVGVTVLLASWKLLRVDSAALEWLGIGIVVFITYVIYQAVKTWIDGKIEDEEIGPAHADNEDGMGAGASRLATLLPLLRNVLVIVIFAVIGTVVLSGMGVNVAPLFAGAGIVGLAIGFGAQTLIRDIFSGAFFLADDAFRRGEYIDAGGVMGAVEKISIRSFQLRHHNGPLHTIPFGEIKQLTNFSRDWVIMKLKLRLVYGTDIEKVRKLIKTLGQELAADPEIGHLFDQPLKSQGVVEMEDSAMICRVKFMTKPGDQFLARRHVYTRINALFEREGISFASRQVTVRVLEEQDGTHRDIASAARAAAMGGVQPVIDAEVARPGG